MKAGDTVWFFNGIGISEFICDGLYQEIGGTTRIEGHYHGREHQRTVMNIPYPVFPTREALCEYYRKMFGGIDKKALLDEIDILIDGSIEYCMDDSYTQGLSAARATIEEFE